MRLIIKKASTFTTTGTPTWGGGDGQTNSKNHKPVLHMQSAANLGCHVPSAISTLPHVQKEISEAFHPPSELAHSPLIPLHVKHGMETFKSPCSFKLAGINHAS